MRPTVHDIAEAAGVSLATVDRVLNRRPGVRQSTIGRVEEAIARIGYVRDLAAANLAKRRIYPLVFILPEGPNAFMRALEAAVLEAKTRSAIERTDIRLLTIPPFDAQALAQALDTLDLSELAGVALVATEAGAVREGVARLHDAGVPVVTLVSDLPNSRRDHYVGIDNVAAGRTAASLLGRFVGNCRGKIAVVAGSMLVRDHVERRMGFDQVMHAEFPALDVLPVLEGLDDGATVARVLAGCLEAHPDVVGVYSLGAGNRGMIEVLEARGVGRAISVVAHELSDHARKALTSGTIDAVINQDAGHEVRSAIRVMKARADGLPPVDDQERIRIDIFLRDNLP
ncbi:LacI family DNA-binding transcriptional regulator [Pararhizobium haloflavum]|uniref:LacI family DNA-binding transcriptional regulator n=1 Tax=Pararhizobium haloflavum TaxID=2037914 RepID=UPI000C190663|nr:LacI family DNA-binding transcriptional regulator [Pararhizobium haloflavum]